MNEIQKYSGLPESVTVETLEGFAARLNEEPKKGWLKKTPDGNAEYIPIGIIEMELKKDFMGLVKFTVVSERRELNELIVVARISVYHPIIGQWLEYDGIGAKVITQKKGTELADFTQFKQKNALEMNAPNAYAEAIKNAAKKIGKKYGADINREDVLDYDAIYTDEIEQKAFLDSLDERLKNCHSEDDLSLLFKSFSEDVQKNQDVVKKFRFRKSEILAAV